MPSLVRVLAGILGVAFLFCIPLHAQGAQQTFFRVKYVSEGTVYLEAGRNAGLKEDMRLRVVRPADSGGATEAIRFSSAEAIAELRVLSVADLSSVCEVLNARAELEIADLAYLVPESVSQRTQEQNAEEAKNYPVVVTFTNGDPLDEEIRETTVPHVMSPPADTQIRGRIGFDYGGIQESGGLNSNQYGLLVQADMKRIGGSWWNFTGYWRGRMNAQSSGGTGGIPLTTLTDLLNRTYHVGFYYENPDSPVTIGVGRLYLPWAPSLSTIDGGYFARKLSRRVTWGFFGGSTPDPTSWSYAPNQHIAGTFVNFAAGNFDGLQVSSTSGVAMTTIMWHAAREFAFFENTLSYKRYWSIYSSLQADQARTAAGGQQYNAGLTQSFTTVRFQPVSRLTFNLNYNYFRNLPTFDPALISTGLLDQYLFQGLSGGIRVDLPWHMTPYVDIGRSYTNTDSAQSWNQLYGLTLGQLWKTGARLDVHYSKFNSSFGQGSYDAVSVSRNLTESLRIEVQGGRQQLNSTFTSNGQSNFANALVDWTFSPRYFMEAAYTWNTGTTLTYQQWITTFGYRFGGYRQK
jgi:hypothetical protein